MNIIFPIWLVGIDYLFGFLMVILIIKFFLNMLFPDENTFFIHTSPYQQEKCDFIIEGYRRLFSGKTLRKSQFNSN